MERGLPFLAGAGYRSSLVASVGYRSAVSPERFAAEYAKLLHLGGARAVRQNERGGYAGPRQRLCQDDVRRHLAGEISLAFAVVEAKTARTIVVDVDAAFETVLPVLRARAVEVGGSDLVDAAFITNGSSAGRGKLVISLAAPVPRDDARRLGLDLRARVRQSEPGRALATSDVSVFPQNQSGGVVRVLGRNIARDGALEQAFTLDGEPLSTFERLRPIAASRLVAIAKNLDEQYPPYLACLLAMPWRRVDGTAKHFGQMIALGREAIRLHGIARGEFLYDEWLARIAQNSPELEGPSQRNRDTRNVLRHGRDRAWTYASNIPTTWAPHDLVGVRPELRRLYRCLLDLVRANGLRPHAFATDYESIAHHLEVSKSSAFRLVTEAEIAGIIVRHDRGSADAKGEKGRATLYGLVCSGETPEAVLLAGKSAVDPRRKS